ncbi:DUF2625 domain-containing protein [Campylobacter sp. RM16190]|nr:DUF2625 domain-containing protein [Campylobacter sp. RM16190]
MKTLKELVNLDEPGMKLIKEWSKDAKTVMNFCRVMKKEPKMSC